MRALRDALTDLRRRVWQRYLEVPGRYRWPLSIVSSFFLVIIFVNLVFGGVAEPELRVFTLEPGGEQQTRMRVDPGRNSEVRWMLSAMDGTGEPNIEAVVTGPDFQSEVSRSIDGVIQFKAGFSGGRYRFTMRNLSTEAGGSWDIEWTVR